MATRFGKERVDGYNMLTSILPGVCVSYNGEEIGMEDGAVSWEEGKDPSACNGKPEDFNKTSRDFERTPFHWDDSVNAGFNDGEKPWLPVSDKYKENNLAAQNVDGIKSHYNTYKKLMQLRQSDVLRNGDYKLAAISDNTFSVIRSLCGQESYIYVFNLSDDSDEVDLTNVSEEISGELTVIVTDIGSSRNEG